MIIDLNEKREEMIKKAQSAEITKKELLDTYMKYVKDLDDASMDMLSKLTNLVLMDLKGFKGIYFRHKRIWRGFCHRRYNR